MKTIQMLLSIVIVMTIASAKYAKYGRDEYELNGLRYYDNDTQKFSTLPLRNIKYNVQIENNIAKVELSQYYLNPFEYKI